MTFHYRSSTEEQAIVGEEKVSQLRTFLTYRDTPYLTRNCNVLNKTMEAFCTKKKQVRGEWVPLPYASGWVND